MNRPSFVSLITAGAFCLSALAAAAQEAPKLADGAREFPFDYVASGRKAAKNKEAGSASASRVIGGEQAADGAWPWQVALMVGGMPEGADSQFCGGSLVLDNWVLTASHCVYMADKDGKYFQIHPSRFYVVAGTNLLAPGQGDSIPVEAVYHHPDYDPEAFDNDIALIKLQRAPKVRYKTITVPTPEFGDQLDKDGVTTIVTGWGLVEGGQNPDRLRQVQIQMLDRDQCNGFMLQARAEEAAKGFRHAVSAFGMNDKQAQSAWSAFLKYVPVPFTGNMLCSGTKQGGKTACMGDSGGPLVVPLQDGTYIQAGVVSWGLTAEGGKTCPETSLFSAYTRISNYIGWLQDTINRNP